MAHAAFVDVAPQRHAHACRGLRAGQGVFVVCARRVVQTRADRGGSHARGEELAVGAHGAGAASEPGDAVVVETVSHGAGHGFCYARIGTWLDGWAHAYIPPSPLKYPQTPSSVCRRNSSGRLGGPPVGLGERPLRLASKTSPAAVGAGPGKAMPNAVGLRASKAMID